MIDPAPKKAEAIKRESRQPLVPPSCEQNASRHPLFHGKLSPPSGHDFSPGNHTTHPGNQELFVLATGWCAQRLINGIIGIWPTTKIFVSFAHPTGRLRLYGPARSPQVPSRSMHTGLRVYTHKLHCRRYMGKTQKGHFRITTTMGASLDEFTHGFWRNCELLGCFADG